MGYIPYVCFEAGPTTCLGVVCTFCECFYLTLNCCCVGRFHGAVDRACVGQATSRTLGMACHSVSFVSHAACFLFFTMADKNVSGVYMYDTYSSEEVLDSVE